MDREMKYLVTISQTIEVEADNLNEAEVQAGITMDLGSADFETEEVPNDTIRT